MSTYDAILPAGGEIDPEFANRVGTSNKALIRFGELTILERVIRALRESGRIGRIAVIGPDEVLDRASAAGADLRLAPGASGPDNILRGLDALRQQPGASSKVVVVTTDLPFLNATIVNRFLDSCPPDADISLPLITKEQYQQRFPGSTATFVRLKDGTWTAGCMYLMDAGALERAKPHIDRLFEVRKSKIGMAKLLGPAFLLKFLRKQLTIPELETKILGLLHCKGRAIADSPPELAYDIDYLDDYDFAVKHLKSHDHR